MATGFADAHKTIEERVSTNWTSTSIAYENVQAKEFSDGDQDWVRVTVIEGDSGQIGIGGVGAALHRNLGIVVIEVYTREDKGGRQARAHADGLAALFRGVQDNDITFRTPRVLPVGVDEGWYQVNVQVPFQWDLQA